MSLRELAFSIYICHRLRGYRPKKINLKNTLSWIRQFPAEDRSLIFKATKHIKYVSEKSFAQQLVQRNNTLLSYLKSKEIRTENIIYVSISDAGSSSHVVLNMLRDLAGLDRLGCKLVDANSIEKLTELTSQISEGVIVFVDDFSGTGNQFIENHNFIGACIIGNFSQYFLLHTVCEEAKTGIENRGVTIWQEEIHQKKDRPLNSASALLSTEERNRLIKICQGMAKKGGLGYQDLATMVVFERNAPNSVPLLFRGDKGQKKFFGLIPRTTDLPRPVIA